MRIGYDLRPAQGPSAARGIGRYTRSLLEALVVEAGATAEWTLIVWANHPMPDVALPKGGKTVTLADDQQVLVRSLRRVGKNGPSLLLHRALDRAALRRIASKEHLDTLLLPALFERAFFGAEELACPTIKVCHDLAPHFTGEAYGQGSVYARMYRQEIAALARADAVIAVSQAARQDVLEQCPIPPERVRVIYQGINPIFQPITDSEKQAVRRRWNHGKDYFIASGGLGENKNLETVIDALGHLRTKRGSEVSLLVLGSPPGGAIHPRSALMRQKAERWDLKISEDIIFLPYVSDSEQAALYAAATALVFPSRFEGFGLPPAECMACGTPVIVSNVTSLPEVAGDAGILFDPDDSAGMANAMERLQTDKSFREECVIKGQQQALRFSWANAAVQTLALLRETAGQKP